MNITLDIKTLRHILPITETLHIAPGFLWENLPLLYKIREAVYNEKDATFGPQELVDLILWTSLDEHDFCHKKIKLFLYLHHYTWVSKLERELKLA